MKSKIGILQRTDVGCYTGVEIVDTQEEADAKIAELKLINPENQYITSPVTIYE